MNESVLSAYGFQPKQVSLERIGTGLINHTWKVFLEDQVFILQKINEEVFSSPDDIAYNLSLVADYLKRSHPAYNFVAPVASQQGNSIVHKEGEGYYRLFPFVSGSHSKNTVETTCQAYEAARQFGKFTRLLSGFDAKQLRITIPSFHDLEFRYRDFTAALNRGSSTRIRESRELAHLLLSKSSIVERFKEIKNDPAFRIRVTHHDTKISNVLFDATGKGICVIDLDTLMPGYFISDLGDMMRTYLSPVSEEEKDTDNIVVRDDFYQAIVEGYLEEMKDELTDAEKGAFFYSGIFMTYMQALRFLTDYLQNDLYYQPSYPGHNLVRARNQCVLLQRMIEKEKVFSI
ncbi:phosphotransferase [Terrimonas sp. NA20]|uniref:Phosphotransferase n=1 Tax=Terrimonas ginsenosidimutans TaxID=2908004 RepID=A0ABS9KPJ8_9BACT|nr:phosphotransferase [Terrimonas ginsenosidimutans]MCG2614229.1 phosphotransferase [Terrimonas ginsenosidimutans]